MLTKVEIKKLRKLLGVHYAEDTLNVLNERGILNKFGTPHKPQFIQLVARGLRYNADVIDALLEVAKNRRAEAEERQNIKKEILN